MEYYFFVKENSPTETINPAKENFLDRKQPAGMGLIFHIFSEYKNR